MAALLFILDGDPGDFQELASHYDCATVIHAFPAYWGYVANCKAIYTPPNPDYC